LTCPIGRGDLRKKGPGFIKDHKSLTIIKKGLGGKKEGLCRMKERGRVGKSAINNMKAKAERWKKRWGTLLFSGEYLERTQKR